MKTDIDPKSLHARLDQGEKLRIIDVRGPAEYAKGHLPGAENIPLDTIGGNLPGVNPGEAVVVVCQGGMRSQTACAKVMNSHDRLLNLVGGTSAWIASGYEVEGAQKKAPWSLDRQAHLVAGLLLVIAFALFFTGTTAGIYIALLPAFGLTLDGLTGICPMRMILKAMPWNAGISTTPA